MTSQQEQTESTQKSQAIRFGGKPLGSKYLDRAPSGLRIVILSKGSCLLARSIVEFEQFWQEFFVVAKVFVMVMMVWCGKSGVEKGERKRARAECAGRQRC